MDDSRSIETSWMFTKNPLTKERKHETLDDNKTHLSLYYQAERGSVLSHERSDHVIGSENTAMQSNHSD